MEYVIAYKMLLKESNDEKRKQFQPFLGMSPQLEHAILLIFMSLCWGIDDDAASVCLKCFL